MLCLMSKLYTAHRSDDIITLSSDTGEYNIYQFA